MGTFKPEFSLGLWLEVLWIFCCVARIAASTPKDPPCDSNIYCHGPLLHMVQMSGIYEDDKTFVDQPLKYSPEQVLENFENFQQSFPSGPTKTEIRQFVDDNFYANGHEFLEWSPEDWHADPKFLQEIADPKLRTWAVTLHGLWKELGRTINEDVKRRPERYTLIYVSHPFIIPGGRFREFYYWDSYWIQRGLLRSEMYETVKGMIQNFLEMVELMGFVPNGGRIYYQRTQPPLLIPMMKSYFDATQDIDFLRSSISTLEKEFKFWIKNRMVTVYHKRRKFRVARYSSDRTGPRPESYSDDYELGMLLPTQEARDELYTNIHSATESGWDFSSRWYLPEEHFIQGNLSNTNTQSILPVDLNAILFRNAQILSELFGLIGNQAKETQYTKVAEEFRDVIKNLFWDEELGSYFDYDVLNTRPINDYYGSTFVPLWTGVDTSPETVSRILNYLNAIKIFSYPGGIPASLFYTGQQWDFPNAWPPLNHIAIEALAKSGDKTAQAQALQIAETWVQSNFKAFNDVVPHTMFEKYDASWLGAPGRGGEYTVVAGFGWTNGIVLDLLSEYGSVLSACPVIVPELPESDC